MKATRTHARRAVTVYCAYAAVALVALAGTAFRWPDQTPAAQQDAPQAPAAAPAPAAPQDEQLDEQRQEEIRRLRKTAAEAERATERVQRLLEQQAQQRAHLKARERNLERDLVRSQERDMRALLAGYRAAREQMLDLDLDDVSVRDAFRRVFRLAGQQYTLDDDLPDAPRVSLRASRIRLSTALALLAESAGVHWSVTTAMTGEPDGGADAGSRADRSDRADGSDRSDRADVRCMFRVGRGLDAGPAELAAATAALNRLQSEWSAAGAKLRTVNGGGGSGVGVGVGAGKTFVFAPGTSRPYRFTTAEERATFTCPHCHGQVTTLRERQQPICPTCGHPFQPGWAFCPTDGTPRPATTVQWKFCPLCGKPIRIGDPCEKKSGAIIVDDVRG